MLQINENNNLALPKHRLIYEILKYAFSILMFVLIALVILPSKVMERHVSNPRVPTIMWYTEPEASLAMETDLLYLKCFDGFNVKECKILSNDNNRTVQQADAYIFYGTKLKTLPPRKPHTLFGLLHEESPKNVPALIHETVLNVFNYSATFSTGSSVPYPLYHLVQFNRITSRRFYKSTALKNKFLKLLAPVVYMQTQCSETTNRDAYVAELMKHIKVDSYGNCQYNRYLPLPFYNFHHNGEIHGYRGTPYDEPLLRYLSKYKFMIAIENAVCQDYVTEKFWRSIYMGVVPIYFGAPNVRDVMPNNKSAVLISDYPTPELLARHLYQLLANDTKYEEYLEHKVRGRVTNMNIEKEVEKRPYQSSLQTISTAFQCKMCLRLHDKLNKKTNIVTKKHYNCSLPVSVLTQRLNPTNEWFTTFRKVSNR